MLIFDIFEPWLLYYNKTNTSDKIRRLSFSMIFLQINYLPIRGKSLNP